MPTYSETMSGGVLGNGSASCFVIFNPQYAVKAGVVLPIQQFDLHPNQTKANRLSGQANGLTHWWRFDHPEGPTIYDNVSGYDGDIVSSDPDLCWQYDPQRRSWVWVNSGTDYIQLPHIEKQFVNNATKFSITAWINMDDINDERPIISRDSVAGSDYFNFGWEPGGGFVARFNNITTNGRTGELIDVTSGTWYHVALVYNGGLTAPSVANTNLRRLRIFVNGIRRTLTYNGVVPTSIFDGDKPFLIGKAASEYFLGKMDDVRFYNRDLVLSEIQSIYNNVASTSLLSMPMVLAAVGEPDPSALVMSGSASLLGAAAPDLSGGLKAGRSTGGDASVAATYAEDMEAGAKVNGEAFFVASYMPTGGVEAEGFAVHFIEFDASGGVVGKGSARLTGITNEPPFGSIIYGLKAAGSADASESNAFVVVGQGVVIVEGSSKAAITNVNSNAEGGIVITGDGGIRFVFEKRTTFLWRINQSIQRRYTFLWNIGRLQMFWYRVVSKPLTGIECPLIGEECCQKFIINVHARSLAELCGKLSKRRYKFPIDTVHRFSRPAENSVVEEDEANGIDHTCQTMTLVEVCGIPACADFCVQSDLKQNMKFESFVQVNSFLSYTATGEAFTSGAAITSFTKILPSFPYVGGGSVTMSGSGDLATDHYTMRGGVLCLGDTAFVESSRYYYVGGEWPNVTSRRFGSINESLIDDDGEQIWALPDRVNLDDGLYSQTDISFGKKSQQLITTGFGLTVPSWARVIGIILRVSRLSTQIAIRDVDIYLVRGGEQISDNLADLVNDWPLIETEKVYGSSGIDGRVSFRDPDGDHYMGDFTPDDLNDPTFGVLIRVRSRQSLGTQIAKINFVNLEAYYELEEGSLVRVSGESRVLARDYNYLPSGKTVLSSLSSFKVGHRFNSKGLGSNGSGEIEPSGHAAIRYEDTMSGGAESGGEANVTPYFDKMSGGAESGGEANITPYFETMSGGVVVAGVARRNYRIHYVGNGVITLNSESFIPEAQYRYIGSGSFTLGSNNHIRSNSWKWVSDGNAVFILGGADQKASSIGTPVQEMTFGMTVLQIIASFSGDAQANNIGILTDKVQQCSCEDMDLRLQLTQNLFRENILSNFLARNSFDTPTVIWMRYNLTNNSWQCNLHYRGTSPEGSSLETWDIAFELQCTDVMGGIQIGRQIWKMAIYVLRKNLVSREAFETRIIVGVLPDTICNVQGAGIDFDISYDTQVNLAVVSPTAVVYQNTIYDNIGLFKNRSWIDDPDLNLKISQASRDRPVTRVNFTKTVPASQ